MDAEVLQKACEKFKIEEGRASVYDFALKIVDDHPSHAAIILLAVWNMNRFRFMANDTQKIADLENAIEACKPLFEQLKEKDFANVNFDEIKGTIEIIYSKFYKIKGVEYTGTSKVMHLLNRNLFVMWDKAIRSKYGISDPANGTDYYNFLKIMQEKFKGTQWGSLDKTLAKAIDEYNQVTITIPKMKKQFPKKKREQPAV